MNRMLKNVYGFGKISIIIALIVVAAAVALFFGLRPGEQEPIKIGTILSLSGPASHLVDLRDAMVMAVEEVNSRGGVNGRKIELIIEDNKTNREEAKKAFDRIESAHRPTLYVSALSSMSMAVAPLAGENRVPLMALVATTPKLASQNEWTFRYFMSAEDEVAPIMTLLEKWKIKNLGILYQEDAYGSSVYKLLKERFEKTGGSVRGEPFETKNPDFRARVAELKDMEAIYIVGFVKPERKAIKRLREDNYQGFILGASGFLNSLKTTPETNGMYVAAPIIYNPTHLLAKKVKEKFEETYHKPFYHQAANGYHFVILLSGLLEDKEISRESVKEVLEGGFRYPGVFGDLNAQPGKHSITLPLHPARIVNGEVKYLQ